MGRTGAQNLTHATHRPTPPTFTRGSSYDRLEGYAGRSWQDRGCASIMACHSGSAAYIERVGSSIETLDSDSDRYTSPGPEVSVRISSGGRPRHLILMTKYLHLHEHRWAYPDRRSLIVGLATIAMLLWCQPRSALPHSSCPPAVRIKGEGMSACRDCPIPSSRPRLWGSGSASLKKAAICERQLNEAGRYRENFMSIFDDLPPA